MRNVRPVIFRPTPPCFFARPRRAMCWPRAARFPQILQAAAMARHSTPDPAKLQHSRGTGRSFRLRFGGRVLTQRSGRARVLESIKSSERRNLSSCPGSTIPRVASESCVTTDGKSYPGWTIRSRLRSDNPRRLNPRHGSGALCSQRPTRPVLEPVSGHSGFQRGESVPFLLDLRSSSNSCAHGPRGQIQVLARWQDRRLIRAGGGRPRRSSARRAKSALGRMVEGRFEEGVPQEERVVGPGEEQDRVHASCLLPRANARVLSAMKRAACPLQASPPLGASIPAGTTWSSWGRCAGKLGRRGSVVHPGCAARSKATGAGQAGNGRVHFPEWVLAVSRIRGQAQMVARSRLRSGRSGVTRTSLDSNIAISSNRPSLQASASTVLASGSTIQYSLTPCFA